MKSEELRHAQLVAGMELSRANLALMDTRIQRSFHLLESSAAGIVSTDEVRASLEAREGL